MPIKVLIAEDEPSVREALTDLVSSDPDLDVVATAGDADEAIRATIDARPDVALVDVKMPAGGGPRATREILAASPTTRVVALSAYEDRRTVLEMLRAGVVGYLVKGTPAAEILRTIKRSIRGEGSLSVEITGDVIRELADLLQRSEVLTHELRELNRTKSDLIQILSHELFTPITVIQGFAYTVAEQGSRLSPEDARVLANGVEHASHRLRRLVGNLSAAARLDREGVEVATRPTEVRTVLDRAAAAFPGQSARLHVDASDTLLDGRLWADPDLAATALAVLIENAFEFGGDEVVDIRVERRPEHIDLGVADRGPGLAEDRRAQVFDAFTQAESATTTRTHEGLGIGLYLASRIMRAHGGRVSVAPRDSGGTVFTLTFASADGPAAGS
jgi:signal transduction histidine kinase